MRFFITLICFLMLTACVTTHPDYTQAIQSWHGSSSQSLIARWGTPHQIIKAPNGNSYYVYSTESQIRLPYPDQSRGAIVIGKGTSISASLSNENPAYANVHCTTTFEVNRKNVVVASSYSGGDCVANGEMVNSRD